ncbi:MAG: hypothetical protein HOP32_02085 [Nitrospira sp.]|nr:hypothetical protein [Nitrospira sp.]
MQELKPSKKKRRRVGHHIVRAWFDTVINPLLESFEQNQKLLIEKRWTWRFRPGYLEALQPARSYVEEEAWPNLEQFTDLYPNIRNKIKEHDGKVSVLQDTCGRLFKTVSASQELADLYRRVTSPQALSELGVSLQHLFGAFTEPDHIAILSEYVVNNTGFLPSYYATSPLWNKHRGEFLAILDKPSIQGEFRKVLEAGEALAELMPRLICELKDVRSDLSLQHDVPPYAASAAKSGEPLTA